MEYRLLECQQKRIKLSDGDDKLEIKKHKSLENSLNEPVQTEKFTDEPDRVVQLQISENGVFSVHSLSMTTDSDSNCVIDNTPTSTHSMPVKNISPETMELMKSVEKTVSLDFQNPVFKDNEYFQRPNAANRVQTAVGMVNFQTKQRQEKDKTDEKHSDTLESTREDLGIQHSVTSNTGVTGSPGILPNKLVHVQKVYPGAAKESSGPTKLFKIKDTKTEIKELDRNNYPNEKCSTKSSPNIRYKTLKTSVKPWNPSIPRSAIMAMKQANKDKSEPNEKAINKSPKFFKMRNMPRFLGNPSSGVKPMYQVLPGAEPKGHTPQTSTSQTTKSSNELTVTKIDPKTLRSIPVSTSVRSIVTSSPNKLITSYSSTTPKTSNSHGYSSRSPNHNPASKSSNPPGPALTNPFILPPHMMYNGFPRPFDPQSRLPTDNQIFRAMSMLCSQSGAFHPSLPPSISMLFNPHHPHHRSSQSEKLKYVSEFHKSSPTPSVQRVPPSCPTAKNSLASSFTPGHIPEINRKNPDNVSAKPRVNEKHVREKQEIKMPNYLNEAKCDEIVAHKLNQKGLSSDRYVPLCNGFDSNLFKCTVDKNNCDKIKVDKTEKMVQNVDNVDQNVHNDAIGKVYIS